MEKKAFTCSDPLKETTRHHLREEASEEFKIFPVPRRPVTTAEVNRSPSQADKTYPMVDESTTSMDVAVIHARLKRLEEVVDDLKLKMSSINSELYGPLFSSREIAVTSPLVLLRDKLNLIVEAMLQKMSKRDLESFAEKFHEKKTYLQLLIASGYSTDSQLSCILQAAEEQLVAEYQAMGLTVGHACIRETMLIFRNLKKLSDIGVHLFDYNYYSDGPNPVAVRRRAWTTQAQVLLDVQNAIDLRWLKKDFSKLADPETGILSSLVLAKKVELELESGFSLEELSQM